MRPLPQQQADNGDDKLDLASMSRLTSERRNQLAKAHDALNRGDHGLAAAYFFEGIDGFLERMSVVLARTDIPTVARKPSEPKPPKLVKPARRHSSDRDYADKRRQAVEILTAIPETSVARLATQLGVSQDFIFGIKKQLGIPASVNGRNLREKARVLLAECPQISIREIATKLNCSTNYAATLCREADGVSKEQKRLRRRATLPGYPRAKEDA